MRFLTFFLALTTTASCLAACGGKVFDDSGSSTGAGAGSTGAGAGSTGAVTSSTDVVTSATGAGAGTTGGGGKAPAGDCAIDADCGTGTCAPLTPGGYLVCLNISPATTSCSSPKNPKDQCCTSADCNQGSLCYSILDLIECFGGPAVPVFNECASDQCESDADCKGGSSPQICAPAGAFHHPVRACFTAYCHTDADCTAQPGGACVTVSQPCCGVPAGLACVYPDGCRKDADCGQGDTCQIKPMTGSGQCMPTSGVCPV